MTGKAVVPHKTKPLSDRQRLFVDEYMIDRNATQAYIRAGFSPKGAQPSSSKLLLNPMISAEITRRVEEYSRTAGMTMTMLLEEARKIAFSDIADIFDAEGNLLPIQQIPPATRVAIAGIEVLYEKSKIIRDPGGKDEEVDTLVTRIEGVKKVKMYDKLAALMKLIDYFGDKTPVINVTNNVTNNVQVNVDRLLMELGSHAPVQTQR